MEKNDLPVVEAAAGESWGPAMGALNPPQRAFVLAYVTLTNADASEAARKAGYIDHASGSIRVTGFRLAHNPKVLAAIHEVVVARVSRNLPVYVNALERVAANDTHKDQVRAIGMLLNRGGLPEVTERNVNVSMTLTKQEKIAEIRRLVDVLGLDAKKLL